jgi:hypothetical protein
MRASLFLMSRKTNSCTPKMTRPEANAERKESTEIPSLACADPEPIVLVAVAEEVVEVADMMGSSDAGKRSTLAAHPEM